MKQKDAVVLDTNVIDPATVAAPAPGAECDVPALPGRAPAPEPEDIGELYVRHWPLLMHVGARKFRIPESEAEPLIQEVFVSYMMTTTTILNVRAWLVAAMCNASRHYWRGQCRTESLPDDFDAALDPSSIGLAEKLAREMTVAQAIQYLQPRCRETLHLHYYEGRSAVDVARVLETTTRYAEKLIHNCLKRVREIYFSITAVKR
jgi:RNA polymerase sigma factor (sigma-70 family)